MSIENGIDLQDHESGMIAYAERMETFLGKAEETRLASENARMLLELHRKEHGC